MAMTSRRFTFTHRTRDDGTVESICMNCFITVSRTWGDFKVREEELVKIEAAHKCDESRKSKRSQYSEGLAEGRCVH